MFPPSRDLTLLSPLSAAAATAKLKSVVAPMASWQDRIKPSGWVRNGGFMGEVRDDGTFDILRDINYRNSFLPFIKGRIDSDGGGSRITARMAMHKAVVIFTTFWLAFVTLAIYSPVLRCEFINYDDSEYFTENAHVLKGLTWENLSWAARTTENCSWYPLTWISFLLDVSIFGTGPMGPHLTNLLLHAANTVLLFILLYRLTTAIGRSAFVATLWGVTSANVIWLPLGNRLKRLGELECARMELAIEGVAAIQSGQRRASTS